MSFTQEMKKCWHCPLLDRLNLLSRIMVGTMLILSFAFIILFWMLAQREAYLMESALHFQLQEELRAISNDISEDLVIGDYAKIESKLNEDAGDQHVGEILFKPETGKVIRVSGKATLPQSPTWFVTLMNSPSIHGAQAILLGGKNYGEIKVQMNPLDLINDAWNQIGFMFKIALAALFLNGLVIYLILRSNLKPLKYLMAEKQKFASGDYTVRLVVSGPPEIRELMVEFNNMAQQIEKQTNALQESEQLWSFALEGGGDGVWDWNLETNQISLSKAGKAMFGFSSDNLSSDLAFWIARVHPEDIHDWSEKWHRFFNDHAEKIACEYRVRCNDGHWIWIFTRGMVVLRNENGRVTRMIGTHTDISERKRMEDQVHHLAFYDTLTNLPNRRLLNDRLNQAMSASKRSGCYCALLFLDLDNFKPVNDRHGHRVGDLLLIEAATRLKNCVREMDTVARLGGDEFVVILSELSVDKGESVTQARIVAEKILKSLSAPFLLANNDEWLSDTSLEHQCTASIGVMLFFSHEIGQDYILKWADEAMYQAKEAGRNQICFHDSES